MAEAETPEYRRRGVSGADGNDGLTVFGANPSLLQKVVTLKEKLLRSSSLKPLTLAAG